MHVGKRPAACPQAEYEHGRQSFGQPRGCHAHEDENDREAHALLRSKANEEDLQLEQHAHAETCGDEVHGGQWTGFVERTAHAQAAVES